MAEDVTWTAYCAPGREDATRATLDAGGTDYDEVIGHPYLAAKDWVILVNRAEAEALRPPYEMGPDRVPLWQPDLSALTEWRPSAAGRLRHLLPSWPPADP